MHAAKPTGTLAGVRREVSLAADLVFGLNRQLLFGEYNPMLAGRRLLRTLSAYRTNLVQLSG